MKILLAEDDENISLIIRIVLQKIGEHEVEIAADGQRALDMALAGTFDLILLDGMMPKMGGLRVAELYMEKCQAPAPIIFLSAKSQQSDIDEFLSVGIGYIQKPFNPKEICQRIDDILMRKRQSA